MCSSASAGVGEFAAIGKVSEEHFDKIFGVNVRGTLFTVQKALPLFADGGSIILNASVASIKGFPNFGVYNASKAAVRSFARSWTNDLKERKIRVNALSPGTIDTAIFDDIPKDAKAYFVSLIPRGTIGQPEEIADGRALPRLQRFRASSPASSCSSTAALVKSRQAASATAGKKMATEAKKKGKPPRKFEISKKFAIRTPRKSRFTRLFHQILIIIVCD